MKPREYKIPDVSRCHSLRRLSALLNKVVGSPESYGTCFDFWGEIWGFTWLNTARSESVSYNFRKHKQTGITSVFVVIRRLPKTTV